MGEKLEAISDMLLILLLLINMLICNEVKKMSVCQPPGKSDCVCAEGLVYFE